MMGRDYKPATGSRPGTTVLAVLAVVVTMVAAFTVGRVTAPTPAAPPAPEGIRYVDGIPQGWPGTPRGAGETAAAYLSLMAAAAVQPREQIQALLQRMVTGDQAQQVVVSLLPSNVGENNPNISQTLVARLWAGPAATNRTPVPDGTPITVKALLCTLTGPVTDGVLAGPAAGLAGGWYVQTLTMTHTNGRWYITAIEVPVPVPPPDVRGTTRDGSTRDTQPLLEVLSPDSWTPGTP